MPRFEAIVAFSDVDLQDYDTLEALAEHLPSASWQQRDEESIIVAALEAPTATIAVEEVVRLVRAHFHAATAPRVLDDLMSTADIAALAGVHRETVRLWATGKRRAKDFPRPISVVRPDMKVWAASDVYAWLRSRGIPCPSATPLTMAQVVDANRQLECAALTHLVKKTQEWRPAPQYAEFTTVKLDFQTAETTKARTKRAVFAVR